MPPLANDETLGDRGRLSMRAAQAALMRKEQRGR